MKTAIPVILSLVFSPCVAVAQGGTCLDCMDHGTYSTCLYLQQTGFDDCWQSVPDECHLGDVCPAPSGCFLAGTLVRTPTGDKPIESLSEGDLVISRDARGQLAPQPITATHRTLSPTYLVINGSLAVTDEHPFMSNGGWSKSATLSIGDRLQTLDGTVVDVVSIKRVSRGVRVYNISVGEAETYFANGLLVHNKPPTPGS